VSATVLLPIKAAALHFVLAHPAASFRSFRRASRPERIMEDYIGDQYRLSQTTFGA